MTIGTVFGRIAGEEAARHARSVTLLLDAEARASTCTICNACRYCEGYCAVFPAMERRLDVRRRRTCTTSPTSATTAARATTPASTRRRTSSTSTSRAASPRSAPRPTGSYAWPRRSWRASSSGTAWSVSLATAAALALFLLATFYCQARDGGVRGALRRGRLLRGDPARRDGLRSSALCRALRAARAARSGFVRFWRDTGEPLREFVGAGGARARRSGTRCTSSYLDGGGDGCTVSRRAALARAAASSTT